MNQGTLSAERQRDLARSGRPFPTVPDKVFSVEEVCAKVRYCLCLPDREESGFCPLCDDVLDKWGHHCRRCCIGSDKVIWHNGVRARSF